MGRQIEAGSHCAAPLPSLWLGAPRDTGWALPGRTFPRGGGPGKGCGAGPEAGASAPVPLQPVLLLAPQTRVALWLPLSRTVSEWVGRAPAAQTRAGGGRGWDSGFYHPVRARGDAAIEEDGGGGGVRLLAAQS